MGKEREEWKTLASRVITHPDMLTRDGHTLPVPAEDELFGDWVKRVMSSESWFPGALYAIADATGNSLPYITLYQKFASRKSRASKATPSHPTPIAAPTVHVRPLAAAFGSHRLMWLPSDIMDDETGSTYPARYILELCEGGQFHVFSDPGDEGLCTRCGRVVDELPFDKQYCLGAIRVYWLERNLDSTPPSIAFALHRPFSASLVKGELNVHLDRIAFIRYAQLPEGGQAWIVLGPDNLDWTPLHGPLKAVVLGVIDCLNHPPELRTPPKPPIEKRQRSRPKQS